MSTEPQKSTVLTDKHEIRPSYYTSVRHQVIDVVEDWGLDFLLGNVLKYIQRAGKKDPTIYIQELQKARTYLTLKLERLQSAQESPVVKAATTGQEVQIPGPITRSTSLGKGSGPDTRGPGSGQTQR